MGELLGAREAAARLGVDVRTLYAYVSRGSLSRAGSDERRRSRYDSDEVELLAQRGRPRTLGRSRAGVDVVIGTAVSELGARHIRYRGHDVGALAARDEPFESVAALLWGAEPADGPWSVPAPLATAVRRMLVGADPGTSPLHRMMIALVAADGAANAPPDAACALPAARAVILALALSAGGELPTEVAPPQSIAHRLWVGLSPLAPTPARLRALNRALVLLADHELSTSTLAVRVAASARASLGSCPVAGLTTLSGAAHGGVAGTAHRALRSSGQPTGAAGFGHPLYPEGDPRAALLLAAVRSIAAPTARERIDAALAQGAAHGPPTADFALGALCFTARMPTGAAQAIFAVARAAGWIAHAAEEFTERPLRFRGRAVRRRAP